MPRKQGKKIFVLDTSVILYNHSAIYSFEDNDVAIPITVLEELDHFKKGNDTKNFEARIYWNKNSHESYIDVLALPIPDEGKQYQLWALVGGKPIDAGVFEITLSGIQRVKDIPAADAWAVTLDPKGGSVSPTLDQMYLLGKAS